MNRRERQSAILELVRDRALSTQAEVASALRETGFEVVQTTVSRDIADLRGQSVHKVLRRPGLRSVEWRSFSRGWLAGRSRVVTGTMMQFRFGGGPSGCA